MQEKGTIEVIRSSLTYVTIHGVFVRAGVVLSLEGAERPLGIVLLVKHLPHTSHRSTKE
jgi:hypothetical protein